MYTGSAVSRIFTFNKNRETYVRRDIAAVAQERMHTLIDQELHQPGSVALRTTSDHMVLICFWFCVRYDSGLRKCGRTEGICREYDRTDLSGGETIST